MIITIHEGSTFYLDAVQYQLNALNSSIDSALLNMPDYDADSTYICTNLYTTGTLAFTANSSNVTGSGGASFNSSFIGRTLHVTSGNNTGVYVVVDSTSSTHIRVARTGKTGSSEANVLATESGVSYKIATWELYEDNSTLRDEFRTTNSVFRTTYYGKDYATIRDEAMSFLKKNYATKFNNFVASDMGIMLTEAIAYELDSLSWYLDFVANELSMSDAKQVSSIAKLSRYLGYKPRPVTASSTDVTITLTQGYASAINIPAGVALTTPNGVIFETESSIVFGTNSSIGDYVTIGVTQGETSITNFIGSGDAWQEYKLDDVGEDEYLIDGSVNVTVDGVPWTEVDLFEFTNTTDFEVNYVTNPPSIKFGNGVAGQKPQKGAAIQVTKRVGVGSKGNVASDSITAFVSAPQVSGSAIKCTITNSVGATGGADVEDIESIRSNAPKNFLTSDRAVTQSDWDTLASTFSDATYGSIAMAKAKIVRELAEGTALSQLIDTIDSQITEVTGMRTSYETNVTTQIAVIRDYVNVLSLRLYNLASEIDNGKSALEDIKLMVSRAIKDLYLVLDPGR